MLILVLLLVSVVDIATDTTSCAIIVLLFLF